MKELGSILLMEDDPKDVELTLMALKENNLANEVTVVHDGAEGLDYLYRRGAYAGLPPGLPAVILLDVKMPRVDGLQVLRTVKADRKLRGVPVVVLTSSRESRDVGDCYALGANAFVVKPVKFTDFVDAVSHLGAFWALINEPQPGARRVRRTTPPKTGDVPAM